MSYRNLLIWQEAKDLTVKVHKMTMILPRLELFEEGGQIRRSSKSVRSAIVEGYGRRRYKNDFIKYIVYSLSSCDETIDHLETLYETESLRDEKLYHELKENCISLSKKINNFLQALESGHNKFGD